MALDITVRHPRYLEYASAWQLMRDAMDGEDAIKARGEVYLPMKSGTAAMTDRARQAAAYSAYKLRAEFPEIVAPTVRGAIGTMLDRPATIDLPKIMEPLRERATRDGMTLDALHRRIAVEVMTVGRYGLLPGMTADGNPYLAGYVTESIINWDTTDQQVDYVVLDESTQIRNRETGKWENVERYRECFIENGAFGSREWEKWEAGVTNWTAQETVFGLKPPKSGQVDALTLLPFVFIDTSDLSSEPDDVPLYGLAKLAARVYRLDADYVFAMHMTAEPTPVAIGFDDPAQAIKDGLAPTAIGSSKLWLLPKGGDAKMLEFTGAGLNAQKEAIADALSRAVVFGAQILSDTRRTAESGEAMRLRLGNQTSTLKSIAMTSAAGLEKALKNIAVWMHQDPDEVKVEPVTDFFDHTLGAQEITAIVAGWQSGAYSWRSAFDRLQKGGVIPVDRVPEDEQVLIASDMEGRDLSAEELFDPVSGKPLDPTLMPKQLSRPSDMAAKRQR